MNVIDQEIGNRLRCHPRDVDHEVVVVNIKARSARDVLDISAAFLVDAVDDLGGLFIAKVLLLAMRATRASWSAIISKCTALG